MVRSFKYPLLPNRAQERVLEQWMSLCCQLYNAALEQRRDAWRMRRQSVGYVYQCRDLTDLRGDDDGYRKLPVEAARSALRRLERAFQAFFRRCKNDETPGFPRFRSRHRYDSFGIGRVRTKGNRVRIPNLGLVKFKKYRLLRGEVRDVTIRRTAKRWWVCFSCDVGPAPEKRTVESTTGIDVGLKQFAVLANGESVENPRHFRQGEDLLAYRQRALAFKRRGSNSRRRARILVGRAHEHVRDQRLDFHRKLASSLCERFDLIAHEDLNIRGLSRSALAKSVSDAAWGQFIRILGHKAEEAGVWLVPVNPSGTTQRCSRCGETVPKGLGDRVHRCSCGFVADRDHNAALNILALGASADPAREQAEVPN